MILSLRTRRYIADVWLAGYTTDQFRKKVNVMDIPAEARFLAMNFWLKMEGQMTLANYLIKEKK